jgi:hypothetical protein
MNQVSTVSFSTDATVLSGYAQAANERLGNVDFMFENTGNIAAFVQVRQFDGTAPSGYSNVGGGVTIQPRGTLTRSYSLLTKRVGFFGSGVAATVTLPDGTSRFVSATSVNISANIRNKGDIRGAQIDIVATGRKGWGYDDAFNKGELTKKWGSPPDRSDIASVS